MVKELKIIAESNLKNRMSAGTWIDNTIKGFKKNKKGVIIDPSEKRFADWAKKVMNESGELKAPSELRKLNIDEPVTSNIVAGLKEAFIHWKKFPNIFSPSKWFSKAASDTVRKTATRGQWFLRGSRRGNPWMKWNRKNWDEVIDVAGIGAAKKQYIYELLFRYFQFQIAWGLGETILQSLNATRSNKETRDKVMGCVNARALPDSDSSKASQLKASCESIKTMSEISLLHYWEDPMVVVLLKNMIYDWGDKDAGIMDMATDLFPGKLDDTIIDWVIPYFSGTRDVKTLEEWAETLLRLAIMAGVCTIWATGWIIYTLPLKIGRPR